MITHIELPLDSILIIVSSQFIVKNSKEAREKKTMRIKQVALGNVKEI